MEGDTSAGVLQGTVKFVACNGAAEVGQVDADLVLASGFEADFNEGIGLVSGDYFVGGDGPARIGPGPFNHTHFEIAAFLDEVVHHAFGGTGAPLADGEVGFAYRFPIGLEGLGHLVGAGENHQSRGLTVEAVDHMGAPGLLDVEPFEEFGEDGVGFVGSVCHGE